MKEVNALRLRNHLGEIIEELNATGEPVLISKARKIRAVLITPDQYARRFLDYQSEEKNPVRHCRPEDGPYRCGG